MSSDDEDESDSKGAEPQFCGPDTLLKELRADWKCAAVISFCRLFQGPLKLRSFSADALEAALLEPNAHTVCINDLLYKLLRPNPNQAYDEDLVPELAHGLLHRKLRRQWPDAFDSNPLEASDFFTISAGQRLEVMYALCEWRLECPVLRETFKSTADDPDLTGVSLRHEPVGEDHTGRLYYYFSLNNEDCRLYRESPPRRWPSKRTKNNHSEALWETVCSTLEELTGFVDKLGTSGDQQDKDLHTVLAADILPSLAATAAVRRRAEEKAAALEAMPRKRSSRVQELALKKKEEEEQRAREAEHQAFEAQEAARRRKEHDREARAKAHQDHTQQQHELNRRLAGLKPDGPSRQERYLSRVQQAGQSEPELSVSGDSDIPQPTEAADPASAPPAPPPQLRRSKRRIPPGWNPLGPPVHKRLRTSSTRPRVDLALLQAAVKGETLLANVSLRQASLTPPVPQPSQRKPRTATYQEKTQKIWNGNSNPFPMSDQRQWQQPPLAQEQRRHSARRAQQQQGAEQKSEPLEGQRMQQARHRLQLQLQIGQRQNSSAQAGSSGGPDNLALDEHLHHQPQLQQQSINQLLQQLTQVQRQQLSTLPQSKQLAVLQQLSQRQQQRQHHEQQQQQQQHRDHSRAHSHSMQQQQQHPQQQYAQRQWQLQQRVVSQLSLKYQNQLKQLPQPQQQAALSHLVQHAQHQAALQQQDLMHGLSTRSPASPRRVPANVIRSNTLSPGMQPGRNAVSPSVGNTANGNSEPPEQQEVSMQQHLQQGLGSPHVTMAAVASWPGTTKLSQSPRNHQQHTVSNGVLSLNPPSRSSAIAGWPLPLQHDPDQQLVATASQHAYAAASAHTSHAAQGAQWPAQPVAWPASTPPAVPAPPAIPSHSSAAIPVSASV